MASFSKIIGIVGGAGPMASAFLYTSILEVCQKQYNASDYNEFPEIILISFPFTRGNAQKIRQEIAHCFSKLKAGGASLICIASNSFHGFLPELPKTGFIHLITEALNEAVRLKISKTLVLAAQTTIDLKLYEQSSIECLYPSLKEQQLINKLIREVAGGKIDESQAKELRKLIFHIQERSAFDGIIIACTELPMIHRKFPIEANFPIVDTVEVLANRLVQYAHN